MWKLKKLRKNAVASEKSFCLMYLPVEKNPRFPHAGLRLNNDVPNACPVVKVYICKELMLFLTLVLQICYQVSFFSYCKSQI